MRFFDLHCDTIYRIINEDGSLYKNNFDVSINKAKKYDKWIQSFAIWVPDELRGEKAVSFFKKAIETFEAEIEKNNNFIMQINEGKDLEEILSTTKRGAVLTIENGAAIGGDIQNLYYASAHGTKMMTLTWNGRNEIGDGALVEDSKGISDFGREVISEMNKLSMTIDVSHASDRLFYDVINLSTAPVIATHSNSREICPNKRNLTKEQFELIRDMGGIVGINFHRDFLNVSGKADFWDVFKHVDYFMEHGGEKTICIGSDFDGADLPECLCDIKYIEELYNYFKKMGYTEELLDNIFFNNAYNFFKRNKLK